MSEKKYYLLSDDNCKYEGMTKEQVIAAIQQAADEGKIENIDAGFVTKLKELNRNQALQVWIGTQAEYNALEKIVTNTLYLITDETHEQDIQVHLKDIEDDIEGLSTSLSKVEDDTNQLIKTVDLYQNHIIPQLEKTLMMNSQRTLWNIRSWSPLEALPGNLQPSPDYDFIDILDRKNDINNPGIVDENTQLGPDDLLIGIREVIFLNCDRNGYFIVRITGIDKNQEPKIWMKSFKQFNAYITWRGDWKSISWL